MSRKRCPTECMCTVSDDRGETRSRLDDEVKTARPGMNSRCHESDQMRRSPATPARAQPLAVAVRMADGGQRHEPNAGEYPARYPGADHGVETTPAHSTFIGSPTGPAKQSHAAQVVDFARRRAASSSAAASDEIGELELHHPALVVRRLVHRLRRALQRGIGCQHCAGHGRVKIARRLHRLDHAECLASTQTPRRPWAFARR